MLKKYTWCLPLHTKKAKELVYTYLVNIYVNFSRSNRILSHFGTEFKNKLFTQVASTLVMQQVFRSLYHPQGNRCFENLYKFPKMCIRKHFFWTCMGLSTSYSLFSLQFCPKYVLAIHNIKLSKTEMRGQVFDIPCTRISC